MYNQTHSCIKLLETIHQTIQWMHVLDYAVNAHQILSMKKESDVTQNNIR